MNRSLPSGDCFYWPNLVYVIAAMCLVDVADATPGHKIQQVWPLLGGESWDYMAVDPSQARLFVTRSTHVDVLNTDTGALVGTIENTAGVHGVAFAQELKRGFASNGKADSITVFDLVTLKPLSVVPVPGHNPDAILYEPTGRHVFSFNGKSKDVSVFDAQTLQPLTTLAVADKPEFAVDDGAGKIYVNIESEPGQMVAIDSRGLKVLSTWVLPGCNSPSGLALDKLNHRLFSVCDDKTMVVTNAINGKQVAKIAIGEGPDAAAYDMKRHLIYSSNADGTLTIIHQDTANHYRVLETVATKHGARTMALNSANGVVFTISADFVAAPPATEAQPRPRSVPKDGTVAVMKIIAPAR